MTGHDHVHASTRLRGVVTSDRVMMNGVTSAFELSKVNCRGVESLTIYVDCGAGRTGKEFTFRNKIKQQITIYTVFREKKLP